MRCPFCGEDKDRVIDSRPNKNNTAIRRRRMCENCEQRFTTYEYTETFPVQIIKKDGRREDFNREKLLIGLKLASRKRSIPVAKIESIIEDVYDYLLRQDNHEAPSTVIGELVMDGLRKIDQVAYVRFASVYKEFKDLEEFKVAINGLSTK